MKDDPKQHIKIGVGKLRGFTCVELWQDQQLIQLYPHQARQIGKILVKLADMIEEEPGYVAPTFEKD